MREEPEVVRDEYSWFSPEERQDRRFMVGAAVLRTLPEGPCEARLFVACAAVRFMKMR